MSYETTKLWAVHSAGETRFLERGVIALDWPEMGDLTALPASKKAFREKFDAVYPEENAVSRSAGANVLYRLVHEVQAGDYVAYPHGETVSLGTVTGDYRFDSASGRGAHCREIRWVRDFPQSAFSRDAMREIGCSPLELFAVKRFAGDFLSPLGVTSNNYEG